MMLEDNHLPEVKEQVVKCRGVDEWVTKCLVSVSGLRSFGHHETVRLFLTKFSYMVL